MPIRKEDVLVAPDSMYISLSKLLGQPVVDLLGYISAETGEAVFKLSRAVLANGDQLDIEGEHDFPYVVEFKNWPQPNLAVEVLEELYESD